MKRNDVIFFLASTVILTIAWIIFSVIHASTTSTIDPDLSQQIEPIIPAFDAKTITTLNNRQKIVPLYSAPITHSSPTGSIIPSPTHGILSPAITITISPTQSASQGGVLQ